MGSIRIREKKDGKKSYTAHVRIKGHSPETQTFSRLTDAKEWIAKVETCIKEGMYFPHRQIRNFTCNDLFDKFIECELPKQTQKRQKECLNAIKFFRQEIGDLFLINLKPADLANCRDKLMKKHKQVPMKNGAIKFSEKTLAPATVNRYLEFISIILEYATRELDYLSINPMTKVQKLKENNQRIRFLELDEIAIVLNEAQKLDYRLFLCILIALLADNRKSEIINLKWSDVDFEHKMIYFMNTKNGEPKGIPMHHILYTELVKFKQSQKVQSINKNSLLFPNKYGKPKEYLIGKMYPKLMKQLKIEDFVFHDLRHTDASWQAMSGIPQIETQKMLGHKTPNMTNRYTHFRAEALRGVVESAGNILLEKWVNSNNSEITISKQENQK